MDDCKFNHYSFTSNVGGMVESVTASSSGAELSMVFSFHTGPSESCYIKIAYAEFIYCQNSKTL